MSKQLSIISKDQDSNISLGNLCQCSVTLRGNTVFFFWLMSRENLLYFSLCPLSLVLSQGTTENHCLPLCPTCRYLYILKSSRWLLQTLFTAKVLQFLHRFCGTSLSWPSSVAPTSSCTKEPGTGHNPLAYQAFLPVLWHMQTCCGHSQPHHLDH